MCVKRALRAAELVLRSGAFGLVVMELHHQKALPAPTLSRLQGLALKHGAVLLFLTEKADHAPSLNSLVSLRGVCRHRRCAETRFSFELSLQVRKDKRRGPGWRHGEVCCGPPGLH
jgi:recombination protein RecA